MKTFSLEEMLDVLVSFDQSINPNEYNTSKGLSPEDFLDAALCKASKLGIKDEFIKERLKNMLSYEIYWDDLNEKAKERLKNLYHENVDLSPLTIIDIEEEDEDKSQLKLEL